MQKRIGVVFAATAVGLIGLVVVVGVVPGSASAARSSALGSWGRSTGPRSAANAQNSNGTGADDNQGDSGHKLVLIAHQTDFVVVDADQSKSDTAGDYVVFTEELRDTHGTLVGQDHVTCLFALPAPTSLCHGDGVLTGRGSIVVEGSIAGDPFVIAVTGGTGEFKNAQGQMRGQSLNSTDTRLTFTLS